MWQGKGLRMYHVRDILREFPGHNYVPDLCTIKPKETLKTLLNLKI